MPMRMTLALSLRESENSCCFRGALTCVAAAATDAAMCRIGELPTGEGMMAAFLQQNQKTTIRDRRQHGDKATWDSIPWPAHLLLEDGGCRANPWHLRCPRRLVSDTFGDTVGAN